MKKYTILFSSLFISLLLAFILPSTTRAYEEGIDQSQTSGGACLTAYSGYNRNQTFLPAKNIITKIDVKMKNRVAGANIVLTLKDDSTGQIVVQTNQRMDDGDGWESFNLVGDSLGYMLDTNHQHSIWIGTDYYSGDTPPCWLYSSSDVYANGNRRSGLTDNTGDMTFITYGYDIDMGRNNPEPPPPPPGEDPEEGVEEPQEEQSDVSNIPDTPQETGNVEILEESEEINEPLLESVITDNSIVKIEEGIVLIRDEETMKVTGTADPGSTVSIFIDESAYTTIADEEGNWYIIFNLSELEEGTYDVDAQATDGDLGSSKVNLFTFIKGTDTIQEVIDETTEEINTGIWYKLIQGNLRWVTISTLGLLGLILLLIIIKRKQKKEEKGVSKKETPISKTSA